MHRTRLLRSAHHRGHARAHGPSAHSPPREPQGAPAGRGPEVKTLRRKLARLATAGRATDFGRALARRRVEKHGDALGFLYVDGHVRVYYGQRRIPKAHVTRMRLAMPATTDYWVNDSRGEPLFVVTAEANAGLCKMLPELLTEARALIGERRTTVVSSTGAAGARRSSRGSSQAASRSSPTARAAPLASRARAFASTSAASMASRSATPTKASVCGGKLRLRQVTRLSEDGTHQTQIVTSRRDLAAVEVAHRMFERWWQENFFKYMREEFALDALVDYGVENDDPAREVPNPRWAAVDAELRAAKAEFQRVSARYGVAAIGNEESARRTMRGFKIANAAAGRLVAAALKKCIDLENRRARVPRRVPVQQTQKAEVVRLAAETQHLTSVLKMVAYQAEGQLTRQLAPHYRRSEDEGRTLVQTALNSAADLEVTEGELRVRLAPLSSPHRTKALAAVCAELDAAAERFPGTKLRVRYAIADHA